MSIGETLYLGAVLAAYLGFAGTLAVGQILSNLGPRHAGNAR